MKKSLFIAPLCALIPAVHAQEKLTVIHQDFDQARRAAQQEGKLLIVDFYTNWCAPCKTLDKTIFQDDSLARQIEKNFVVLKYNAEQDLVHNLSLKNHIASYPATIVFTGEGRPVRKMYGMGKDGSLAASYTQFLQEILVLAKKGVHLARYSPEFNVDAYPDFYKKYVRRISDIKPGDIAGYWKDKEIRTAR